MECVVHYRDSNRNYSLLKSISINQHQRFLEAKKVRENEHTNENKHVSQCETVPPETGLDINVHDIYLEPCYRKFTSTLAPSRKRKEKETESSSTRLERQKQSNSNREIFPTVCFKYELYRKRKDGKTYNAYIITTDSAQNI